MHVINELDTVKWIGASCEVSPAEYTMLWWLHGRKPVYTVSFLSIAVDLRYDYTKQFQLAVDFASNGAVFMPPGVYPI